MHKPALLYITSLGQFLLHELRRVPRPRPPPQVYRGSYEEEAVAVKLFHRGEAGVAALVQQYKDLRGELTVMSQLHHPRVVALVGVCLQPLCMVLPLAPQASLSTHLDLCPQGFDPNVAHRLLYQVRA